MCLFNIPSLHFPKPCATLVSMAVEFCSAGFKPKNTKLCLDSRARLKTTSSMWCFTEKPRESLGNPENPIVRPDRRPDACGTPEKEVVGGESETC